MHVHMHQSSSPRTVEGSQTTLQRISSYPEHRTVVNIDWRSDGLGTLPSRVEVLALQFTAKRTKNNPQPTGFEMRNGACNLFTLDQHASTMVPLLALLVEKISNA